MVRALPLTLMQVRGRSITDLAGFVDNAVAALEAFPPTRLLVYPELHLATDDYEPGQVAAQVRSSAEPLNDGPRHRTLSKLAADLGVWLCPGSFPELDADGRVYNTMVVYSPTGQLVARYRKVFPWRPFEDAYPGL